MLPATSEKLCTRSLAPRERVDTWNKWVNDSVTGLQIDAVCQDDFSAVLQRVALGRLRFMHLASDPAHIHHRREHIVRWGQDPVFLVHLQRRGTSFNYQDGRETVLEQGDYVLRDSTREYDITLAGATENLVLRVPYARLKERISCPESLTCIRMSGSTGVSGLVSNFIQQLWETFAAQPAGASERLADILLDLLVESYRGIHVAGSSSAFARRLQVLQFIEENLRNTELSPRLIADSLNTSLRHLHRLFQDDQNSIGRLILNQRLEACAKTLAEPLQANRSITEIAFRWGFNSSTYFGRAFKDRFGMTPKYYRQLHRPPSMQEDTMG